MTWLTGTYDPDQNLLFWGTGNPNPVHAPQSRKGDNFIYLLDRGPQPRHWKACVVLPAVAPRYS